MTRCEFLHEMLNGEIRCSDGGCVECDSGTHEPRFLADAEGKRLNVTDCCGYCERLLVCVHEKLACARYV